MRTFKPSTYVIVDTIDQPSLAMVAMLLRPLADVESSPIWEGCYICAEVAQDIVHIDINKMTFVEDYGVELVFTEETVMSREVGPSKVTYTDGTPRPWQGVHNIERKLKEYKITQEDFEKEFDKFFAEQPEKVMMIYDKRMKRNVLSKRLSSLAFGGAFLEHLLIHGAPPHSGKFVQDWNRMHHTLTEAGKKAKNDPYSRQLVVSNMDGYFSIQPCFMTIQFLMIPETGFIMTVNQRSMDRAKFYEDLRFFGSIGRKFEELSGHKVFQIELNVADIHRDIPDKTDVGTIRSV